MEEVPSLKTDKCTEIENIVNYLLGYLHATHPKGIAPKKHISPE
jgi:hypothetical protein